MNASVLLRALALGLCVTSLSAHLIEDYLNEAEWYKKENKYDQALAAYRKVLAIDPDNLSAQFNAAIEFFRQQEYDQAVVHFIRVLQLDPTVAQAHFNLGLIYSIQEKIPQSINEFKKAVHYNPSYEKAHLYLANAFKKNAQFEEAISAYNHLLDLNPYHFDALTSLARSYNERQDRIPAIEHFEKALTIKPSDIVTRFELANTYNVQGDFDNAIKEYTTILNYDENLADVRCNLAHTFRYKGAWHEAIPHYQMVIKQRPNNAHAHYGLAESYLGLGNFADGFEQWEWRWKRSADTRNFGQRQWDGSDPNGKRILLRAEYGQGDTIQFIRYAQILKSQGAYVMLEAQYSLVQLLKLCPYIDEVFPIAEDNCLPPFDMQLPIMSFPRVCKTTLETIPATVPYIKAEPSLVNYWKEIVKSDSNFKVGICWDVSPYYESFKTALSKKAIPLATFAPVLTMPGLSFYSLQKINGLEQLDQLPQGLPIHHYDDFDSSHGRFMDTAALIANLDLVITVDTSVAHLAGALGKPVWVILPMVSDWRWMQHRNDSPWYPTMRLFRQEQPSSWESVMVTIVQELQRLKAMRLQSGGDVSVFAEIPVAELVDKITILQIKDQRIKNEEKLKNIRTELASLLKTLNEKVPQSAQMQDLTGQLFQANINLWDIEDAIRDKERNQEFDAEFVEIARSVYIQNDERCRVKRMINKLVGSRLIEEKSYAQYNNKNCFDF